MIKIESYWNLQWFWRGFLKAVNAFSLYGYYLPLEKDMVLHLRKFFILFTIGLFVLNFFKIGSVVLEGMFLKNLQCMFTTLLFQQFRSKNTFAQSYDHNNNVD